jgi:peptidoglycan hydrolase CwlO-like protein
MNRGSVILLCLTTIVVFFILRKQPELDIQKYENQINTLQLEINLLEGANDSLIVEAALLNEKLVEYDNVIDKLNKEIDVIQDETKKKLDSVDRFNRDQLQKFFAERYRAIDSIIN